MIVVAGRESIADEVKLCREDVRTYISHRVANFMSQGWAEEIVESAVRDVSRIPELRSGILARFSAIANGA